MANITITIPDNVLARVATALAERQGFGGGTNAERNAAAKQAVIEYIKGVVKEKELQALIATQQSTYSATAATINDELALE